MHGKREPLNLSYPYDDLSQMVAGVISYFEIIKHDSTGAAPVMLSLSVDNSMATDDTQEIFAEACELYGMDFDYAD